MRCIEWERSRRAIQANKMENIYRSPMRAPSTEMMITFPTQQETKQKITNTLFVGWMNGATGDGDEMCVQTR